MRLSTVQSLAGLFLSITALCFTANAGEINLAQELLIPVEKSIELTLPQNEKDRKTILKIQSRRSAKDIGGFSHHMGLMLNGNPLDAQIDRKSSILIDKEVSFIYPASGKEIPYNQGNGVWLSIFSKNFEASPAQYGITCKKPYTYELDISGFLSENGSNILKISNLQLKHYEDAYKTKLDLIVSVDLFTQKQESGNTAEKKSTEMELGEELDISIADGGAFIIKSGTYSIPFASEFSQPGGNWNFLSKDRMKSADKTWKISHKKISGAAWEISAEGSFYSIKRQITLKKGRVKVQDTLSNKTENEIGIKFSNQMQFGDYPVNTCIMGGNRSHTLNNFRSADNSTIFFPLKNSSLGLVAEDDVYRNHALFFYDGKENKTGMKDDNFCLGPKAKYTVEWSVYLTPSSDYFDFINRVRTDWGANITIPGPIHYVDCNYILGTPEDKLKSLVEKNNAKHFFIWLPKIKKVPEWNNMDIVCTGTAIFEPTFAKEMEKIKKTIEKLRKIEPLSKTTVYMCMFFEGLEKADTPRFQDSWVTTKSGKRALSSYNQKGVFDLQPVFPTFTNSYGKAFDMIVDFYLKELQSNYLYCDEGTGPGVTPADDKGASYATYNVWDGCSAEIDPVSNTITKKFAILALICDPYISSKIKLLKNENSFILFNGAAWTNSRIDSLCWIETYESVSRAVKGHLNTPLGFFFGKSDKTVEYISRSLDWGSIPVYTAINSEYALMYSKFFPLTIMELHGGWVKAKERIITNRSGKFGWEGNFTAKLWCFDKTGKPLEENPIPTQFKDKADIKIPENSIAVLEKIN